MNIKEQILKLDVQDENPCLWILVDTKYYKRDVVITMCGTGNRCYKPIEDYVDSFQVPPFVYHVFVREGD